MKKINNIIKLVCVLFLVFIIIPSVTFLTVINFSDETFLDDKKYDSIEDLHLDLVKAIKAEGMGETDYFPNELAFYLKIEDKWFVFCTYSSLPNGSINSDFLYVYVVKEQDGFILETPRMVKGMFAVLPLHQDYEHWSYDRYYLECLLNNEKQSVGFAFKHKNEQKCAYYDNIKMNETEMINPITGESFILCYATSNKTYNFFSKLFVSQKNRHTLELK